jgi:hypothetical protein
MSIFENPEFDTILANIIYDSRVDSPDSDLVERCDDGQPTHYEECQDLYGGDDYVEQWEMESWD